MFRMDFCNIRGILSNLNVVHQLLPRDGKAGLVISIRDTNIQSWRFIVSALSRLQTWTSADTAGRECLYVKEDICCLFQSLDSLERGDLSVMWWWGWVMVAQAVSMRAYIGSIVVIPKSTAFLDTSRRLRILFSGGIPGKVDLGWLLYLPLWMVWMTRNKLLWEHRKYLCFGLSSNWTGIRIHVNP